MFYTDKRGRLWVKVAGTKGGIYAWFRPATHSDDGSYDRSFRVADMRLA